MAKKHCWHDTGTGRSNIRQWMMVVTCCMCGAKSHRKYKVETVRVVGHGPFFSRRNKISFPVECEEECEVKDET